MAPLVPGTTLEPPGTTLEPPEPAGATWNLAEPPQAGTTQNHLGSTWRGPKPKSPHLGLRRGVTKDGTLGGTLQGEPDCRCHPLARRVLGDSGGSRENTTSRFTGISLRDDAS